MDGQLYEDRLHQGAMQADEERPVDLHILLRYQKGQNAGKYSDVSIYSSPLPISRMLAITAGGGSQCGGPGDHVSWEEADWKLGGQAKS